ncbi:hypothetical protein AB1N83_011692 [Pleurotus pulmonarius]
MTLSKGCIDCDVGELSWRREDSIEEARHGGGGRRRRARGGNVEELGEKGCKAEASDIMGNGTTCVAEYAALSMSSIHKLRVRDQQKLTPDELEAFEAERERQEQI